MSENVKLFLGGIAMGFGIFMWGWYVWQDWQNLQNTSKKMEEESLAAKNPICGNNIRAL